MGNMDAQCISCLAGPMGRTRHRCFVGRGSAVLVGAGGAVMGSQHGSLLALPPQGKVAGLNYMHEESVSSLK